MLLRSGNHCGGGLGGRTLLFSLEAANCKNSSGGTQSCSFIKSHIFASCSSHPPSTLHFLNCIDRSNFAGAKEQIINHKIHYI